MSRKSKITSIVGLLGRAPEMVVCHPLTNPGETWRITGGWMKASEIGNSKDLLVQRRHQRHSRRDLRLDFYLFFNGTTLDDYAR